MTCKTAERMAPLASSMLMTQRCYFLAPKDLKDCVNRMNNTLQSIESWAADSNLLLNETKTKQMLVTTRQMSRAHDLNDYTPPLSKQ